MLILFINAHRKNQEGQARFNNFYNNVRAVLKDTVFFGNEVNETVRNYDDLQDYIYDEITFRTEERARRKFQALDYIFIDGSHRVAPWSEAMVDVLLLIRKSIDSGKKIYCNDFGHFAAYFYLCTHFDKHCTILPTHKVPPPPARQPDYHYSQDTGDLFLKGKRICNSGIQTISSNRPFADRSSNAVGNGVVLSSKFDYVVFNSKSGNKILRDINVPFAFYWKSKVFCTSKLISQAKAQVLFETQQGFPLALAYRGLLSTQGLCGQFLRLLRNWLAGQVERTGQGVRESRSYQSIAFQNKLQYRKTINHSASSLLRTKPITITRPLTSKSKFSTVEFQHPVVRCSGKYLDPNQRYLQEELQKKGMNLGPSRMVFKGRLEETQIGNYVQREPSRPPSSHKFREVHKEKWIGKHDFFNC